MAKHYVWNVHEWGRSSSTGKHCCSVSCLFLLMMCIYISSKHIPKRYSGGGGRNLEKLDIHDVDYGIQENLKLKMGQR